jgi:hypothetical protein
LFISHFGNGAIEMKTAAIAFASLALAKVACAASGQPVLHGSSTQFGGNYPDCGFFMTTADGKTSDDGLTYMLPTNSGGGGGAMGIVVSSDLMGKGGAYSSIAQIQFILLPSTSAAYGVTAAVCPIDSMHVPVGKVGWQ